MTLSLTPAMKVQVSLRTEIEAAWESEPFEGVGWLWPTVANAICLWLKSP